MHSDNDPSESTVSFQRGRYVGLIVAAVVVVLGVAAVLALSGVFERKKKIDPAEYDNVEGCPCSCDRSEAMTAELRAVGGDTALDALEASLATIAEREAAGYVTEAMIAHRLRLLALERELPQTRPAFVAAFTARVPARHHPLRSIDGDTLRARMELHVHGATTEWIRGHEKPLRTSFLLAIELENPTDAGRVVRPPTIASSAPYPISRWYVRTDGGSSGHPWDGKLAPRQRMLVHAIGYVGADLPRKAAIDAAVRFESSTFHLATRARARWNEIEPSRERL
jgi:hypothetical protein